VTDLGTKAPGLHPHPHGLRGHTCHLSLPSVCPGAKTTIDKGHSNKAVTHSGHLKQAVSVWRPKPLYGCSPDPQSSERKCRNSQGGPDLPRGSGHLPAPPRETHPHEAPPPLSVRPSAGGSGAPFSPRAQLWVRLGFVPVPALLLSHGANVVTSFPLSVPQFPAPYNGGQGCGGKGREQAKHSDQCLYCGHRGAWGVRDPWTALPHTQIQGTWPTPGAVSGWEPHMCCWDPKGQMEQETGGGPRKVSAG
jgi:hypothetical protein